MVAARAWRVGQHGHGMGYVVASWPDTEKKSLHAAEQARADIAEARRAWRELQPGLKPEKLIFLDETWAKTNMTRLYGRAPRGKRLIGTAPFGHWKTTTFIAGLRHDRIVAPMVLDGPINGRAFRAWVEQCLAPMLAQGDTVIADNLGSHKVAGVREAIEARGAQLLFLPAYSPDLNPIEQVFAKLKALLRKAAPRTREALWKTIGASLDRYSSTECKHYSRPWRIIMAGRRSLSTCPAWCLRPAADIRAGRNSATGGLISMPACNPVRLRRRMSPAAVPLWVLWPGRSVC